MTVRQVSTDITVHSVNRVANDLGERPSDTPSCRA